MVVTQHHGPVEFVGTVPVLMTCGDAAHFEGQNASRSEPRGNLLRIYHTLLIPKMMIGLGRASMSLSARAGPACARHRLAPSDLNQHRQSITGVATAPSSVPLLLRIAPLLSQQHQHYRSLCGGVVLLSPHRGSKPWYFSETR